MVHVLSSLWITRNRTSRVQNHFVKKKSKSSPSDVKGTKWDVRSLLMHMQSDKKVKNGNIRFVLVRGIGKAFVLNILEDIKKNNSLQTITVETFNKRAQSFYENKLNFLYIGKKLRFFKNLIVYEKKLL